MNRVFVNLMLLETNFVKYKIIYFSFLTFFTQKTIGQNIQQILKIVLKQGHRVYHDANLGRIELLGAF